MLMLFQMAGLTERMTDLTTEIMLHGAAASLNGMLAPTLPPPPLHCQPDVSNISALTGWSSPHDLL